MSSADFYGQRSMGKERKKEFARSYEELAALISQRLDISANRKVDSAMAEGFALQDTLAATAIRASSRPILGRLHTTIWSKAR